MKISKQTHNVLHNFAQINANLMFRPGNVIRTVSPTQSIMASATVSETFTADAGIFDLPQFLSLVSLMGDTDIAFGERSVTLTSGNQSVSYTYAAESMLTLPSPKDPADIEAVDTASVDESQLDTLIRASRALRTGHVALIADGKSKKLVTIDVKDTSASTYSVDLGPTDKTYKATISVDNLKVISTGYNISLHSFTVKKTNKKVVFLLFTTKPELGYNIRYWLVCEEESSRV